VKRKKGEKKAESFTQFAASEVKLLCASRVAASREQQWPAAKPRRLIGFGAAQTILASSKRGHCVYLWQLQMAPMESSHACWTAALLHCWPLKPIQVRVTCHTPASP